MCSSVYIEKKKKQVNDIEGKTRTCSTRRRIKGTETEREEREKERVQVAAKIKGTKIGWMNR